MLYRISSKGDEATIRAFMAMGADINTYPYDGDTALHRAADEGHPKIVRLLLDHGALLEALFTPQYGHLAITPPDYTVHKNHYSTVQLLIDEGADIERDAGWYCSKLSAQKD